MQCVEIASNNAIVASVDSGNCALYLVSANDVILNSVFSLQWVADNGGQALIQQAFYAGFSLPIICHLAAWAYQLLLDQFKH